MGPDSVPAVAGRLTVDTLMNADGARAAENAGTREDSVHLVLAGRRAELRDDDARCRRARPAPTFCDELMDIDDAFGIKSAFQLVPEGRTTTADGLARGSGAAASRSTSTTSITTGAFSDDERVSRARASGSTATPASLAATASDPARCIASSTGSTPSSSRTTCRCRTSAHLEPQRGGCCTVMPYFVGDILELPLTTTQDYSLFHILGDYSTTLWKRQIRLIRDSNGLISFIAHPDYLRDRRALGLYKELLGDLCQLRDQQRVWMALPTEIDAWWRARQEMSLVRDGQSWRVVGPGSERARVAHASVEDGRVVYNVENE